MKPIVKIGAILIALAMLSMVLLRNCGDSGLPDHPVSTKTCALKLQKSKWSQGEDLSYHWTSSSDKLAVDSQILLDGQEMDFGVIGTAGLPLGPHTLRGEYRYADSTDCAASWSIELLSDQEPNRMTYDVLSTYDHHSSSYTQGLVYHNGRLYEGTGQYGESLLYSYVPGSDEQADKRELAFDLFGEGITILNDKIYQLTWKSGKGFVYDINGDGAAIIEFGIPLAEGWGLTNDGRDLILSDGSNKLTYLDPETFEAKRTVHVYTDKGMVDKLNELEYVGGFIYANIYGTSIIAKIEASSGKVAELIDCRDILPRSDYTPEQDVFNGIAYNPDRKTFYVTGKKWSKMFEVRFIKQEDPT